MKKDSGSFARLEKRIPELKIIAMSGANAEALMDAKLLGANASLAKPFTSEMVLKCIAIFHRTLRTSA